MKLFGSYLLILGITLVVEMGISVRVLNTSREQAENLNRGLMLLVKNECDNQLKSVYHNLDILALDDRVQSLSNVKGSFRAGNQYTAYSLHDELQSMRLFSDGDILRYIYFKNTDSVISASGNMSLELYHAIYYKDLDISLEELREYLRQRHFHDIKLIPSEGGPGELMYTMTSLKTEVGEPTATIVTQFKPEIIDEKIVSAKWNEAILVAVINSQNECVNSGQFLNDIGGLVYDELPVDRDFSIHVNGKEFLGVTMQSDEADWKYVLLTPKELVESSAKQVKNYCIAGLGICLIFGFFIAYYLTYKNYNPIKGLMELFRREHGAVGVAVEETANEYQWLESHAKTLMKEHEDVQRTLDRNQKRLRSYYIYKLLSAPYEELDNTEKELLNRSGIIEGIYRVVFLSVGIPPEKEQRAVENAAEEEMTQELKKFIIGNVAGEMLNEVFPTVMQEMGSYVVALVRLEEMNTDNYDRMWGALGKAFDLIKQDFHFYMQICAGTAKEGLENVHFSYLEAKETQEYAVLLDTYYINYKDIKNRSKKYYYPAEADTRIINAITAGKPEPAVACVREILRTNFQQNHITAKLMPCLIYDLLGTFMRSADEIGGVDFYEQYLEDFEDFESLKQKTPDEVEEQFTKLIYALCQETEKAKGGVDTNFSDRIHQYILENFQNPDLNISQVALYFDKTPAYISSVYKKQTGKSLLKLITQTRVDRAIKLLEEGKTVNETAALSGFRDSRNFIRVFKEQTGLTPGQMKKE